MARAARDAGYDVVVVTRVNRHGAIIENEGLRLYPLSLSRRSIDPLRELATLRQITAIYRAERPDLVHHVALKPIIYGSLAARSAGVPAVVNAFTGLGYVFIAQGAKGAALRAVAGGLLKIALKRVRAKTILQNDDDADSLVKAGIVRRQDIVIIRGSGVDLSLFPVDARPGRRATGRAAGPTTVGQGRGRVRGRGAPAARRGVRARFALVGDADVDNPAAVPEKTLLQWRESGDVEWWGHRDDVPAILASCHIVCLPSYREGLPKTLLEAAAAGRPSVTTDVPGCRDIVIHGETGRGAGARRRRPGRGSAPPAGRRGPARELRTGCPSPGRIGIYAAARGAADAGPVRRTARCEGSGGAAGLINVDIDVHPGVDVAAFGHAGPHAPAPRGRCRAAEPSRISAERPRRNTGSRRCPARPAAARRPPSPARSAG